MHVCVRACMHACMYVCVCEIRLNQTTLLISAWFTIFNIIVIIIVIVIIIIIIIIIITIIIITITIIINFFNLDFIYLCHIVLSY